MKHVIAALMLAASLPVPARAPDGGKAPASDWTVAGRLGLMQFIVVPEASARDRDYYSAVIDRTCGKEETCFLRFFTNSRGVALAMPLPDAVMAEPTAMFQRSVKQAREQFQWSCRLQLAESNCF